MDCKNLPSDMNFNYPLLNPKIIEIEAKIKQNIRNRALNKEISREVERYSDKYSTSVSREEILSGIDLEILGPELIKLYGSSSNKEVEELKAEVNENSDDENPNSIEDENEAESLAGGEDYEAWFNEEEELVAEDYGNDDDNVF